jgi:medium-chain acyl-[acyl-carrier-protein] hydrolase
MPGWIHRPAPRPFAAVRLICFPPAGHGSAVFRLWPGSVPMNVEVCAVELPGRGARLREAPISSMSAMVQQLIDALLPELDRPFAFFGHSMGAVLATAVAHSLAQRGGRQPSHLMVSARRPAHMSDSVPPLHTLDDNAFVVEINRRYGGIPAEVLADPEFLAMVLPALRADVAALEQYAPGAQQPLLCPISAFGGTADPTTPRAHLEAWRHETKGQFHLRLFAGGHFYLGPERLALLAEISQILGSMLSVDDGARYRDLVSAPA